MALAPLATVADLTALGIDTSNELLAGSLLASVSAAIRDAAGAPISRETSTFELAGSLEQWLDLEVKPVVSASAASIEGKEVTDFRLIDGRLWRARGWQGDAAPSRVTVTLTHGYSPVPADIVNLVCMFVAAGLAAAEEGFASTRGLSSVRIDDFQESYTRGDDEVIDPTDIPQRTKDALRARFGSGVAVIGTY